MWEAVSSILEGTAVAASGGVVGLVGSLLSNLVSGMKKKAEMKRERELLELEHQQALELKDLDRQIAQAQAQSDMQAQQVELLREARQHDNSNYVASLRHDTSQLVTEGNAWLVAAEFVRKIYRPLLTSCLVWLVYETYQTAPAADKAEIIKSVLFLASTAVGWWFADRSQQRG